MFAQREISWIFIVLSGMITSAVAVGQVVTDEEEITVVAPYQPVVPDAFKINVSPRIPDEGLVKPQFNYSILEKDFKVDPVLDPITPAKIQGESITKLYKNYIKAGIGNYGTPYLDFFANKLRSKKSAFGVRLKHISSAGKIKDYAYPGNSNSEISAYGKRFMPSHTLTTDVYYKRRGVHFYGFRPDEFPDLELKNKDIRQTYNNLGVTAELKSNYSGDRKLNHTVGLGYSFLADHYKTSESNIRFNAGLDLRTEFFDFSEREKLGLDLGLDYFLTSDSTATHNSGILRIAPYYNLGFDQYYFKIGLIADIQSDSVSSGHFYPVIRAEVKVIEDHLITYAGLYGGLEKNSLHSLSDANPFIASTMDRRFTNNKISQYGGVKGRISKNFDYNVSFINSTVRGMAFFVNDTASALGEGLNNQFTVVYDDVKHTRLIAEFGYHYQDKVNVMLRGQYNDYFLDNEDEAWHKPGLQVSLGVNYNMQDKIYARAELFTRSKMYAKVYEYDILTGGMEMKAEELKAMIDLNLGFEYRYSKVLSGFLNLNNLLGQRYYHWYNYPSYRFNLLLGVTYSF